MSLRVSYPTSQQARMTGPTTMAKVAMALKTAVPFGAKETSYAVFSAVADPTCAGYHAIRRTARAAA
jgi:hypothetical protein